MFVHFSFEDGSNILKLAATELQTDHEMCKLWDHIQAAKKVMIKLEGDVYVNKKRAKSRR